MGTINLRSVCKNAKNPPSRSQRAATAKRAGGRGEALRFAAPPSGGAGRVESVSRFSDSEASGRPRPCRRPLPKVLQNQRLFWPRKMSGTKSQKWLTIERLRGPLKHTLVPLDWYFFEELWYQSDSLGCRVGFSMFLVAFRSGQRQEKHGIYYIKHRLPTFAESRVLCSFLHHFKTHLGALGPHFCVQMSPWEPSWEVDIEARAGRVQGRNHFIFWPRKTVQNGLRQLILSCFFVPCFHTWPSFEKIQILHRFGTHFGGHWGALGHILVLTVFLGAFLRSRNKGKIR